MEVEFLLEPLIEDVRGWPALSLYAAFHRSPVEFPYYYYADPGLDLPSIPESKGVQSELNPRALPLRPIWPGFAVNTIFYATLLWLLIPGPFALRQFIRRRTRRRRGLCLACGYPMGESPVCTECGQALRRACEDSDVKRRVLTVAVFLVLGVVVCHSYVGSRY